MLRRRRRRTRCVSPPVQPGTARSQPGEFLAARPGKSRAFQGGIRCSAAGDLSALARRCHHPLQVGTAHSRGPLAGIRLRQRFRSARGKGSTAGRVRHSPGRRGLPRAEGQFGPGDGRQPGGAAAGGWGGRLGAAQRVGVAVRAGPGFHRFPLVGRPGAGQLPGVAARMAGHFVRVHEGSRVVREACRPGRVGSSDLDRLGRKPRLVERSGVVTASRQHPDTPPARILAPARNFRVKPRATSAAGTGTAAPGRTGRATPPRCACRRGLHGRHSRGRSPTPLRRTGGRVCASG